MTKEELYKITEDCQPRVNLSDMVLQYVKLERRGNEYLGICPFHYERTPSFTLNDELGTYHCFGCGAEGKCIADFLLRKYGDKKSYEEIAKEVHL